MSDKHEATYHGADKDTREAMREAAERAANRFSQNKNTAQRCPPIEDAPMLNLRPKS